MKRLVLVLGLVAATVSCKKKDCNCDRVVDVQKGYIIDYQTSTNQVDTIDAGFNNYVVTNDCSKESQIISDFSNTSYVVGECYQTSAPLGTQQEQVLKIKLNK